MIVQIYFGFAHNSNSTKPELKDAKKMYHLECAQVHDTVLYTFFQSLTQSHLFFYEVLSKEMRFPISHKKEAEADESKDDI